MSISHYIERTRMTAGEVLAVCDQHQLMQTLLGDPNKRSTRARSRVLAAVLSRFASVEFTIPEPTGRGAMNACLKIENDKHKRQKLYSFRSRN